MNPRHNHNRAPSQGRKALPAHARPTKPPPLRRGASYNHPQSHSHHAPHNHSRSVSKKSGADDVWLHGQVEDEESGMASFLQFCATCERQIITPGTNILYCSESCRKRDASRSMSVRSIESAKSPSGSSNAASYFEHPPADIIPQMSPTRRPWSMSFSEMSLIESPSTGDSSDRIDWRPGEASDYLGEFLHNTSTNSARPYLHRFSAANDTSLPSLVHSPSSSWGTVASHASYRPLACRHNPFTSDHNHSKSVNLVIPHTDDAPTPTTDPTSPTLLLKDASVKSCASTLTSFRVAEAGDLSYERRSPSSRGSQHQGSHSLKQLFSHDAMKAPPRIHD